MARKTFDEWLDGLDDDLAGVAVRAGMGKGDRSPEYVAFYVLGAFDWTAKKELRPELVERDQLEAVLLEAISDNGGAEPGVMIRLIPYSSDGKKLSGWSHTSQTAIRTESWRELPAGERADQLAARGLAEAVSGITRSQVAFLDKTTDVLATMGQTLEASQAAQVALMEEVLNVQRDWLDAMAQDIGAAAEDLENAAPQEPDDGWKSMVLDILKEATGFGMDADDAEEAAPPAPEP